MATTLAAAEAALVAAIEAVIAGLKGRITVLLVEQYLDFALRVADSVVVLSRGSVVERLRLAPVHHHAAARPRELGGVRDQDEAGHEAAPILEQIGERRVVAVVCTHAHNDHVNAAASFGKCPRARTARR